MTGFRFPLLLLALTSLCLSRTTLALPPDPWDREQLSFRLFIGNLDQNDNRTLLRYDSQRYALGLGASSPVGWQDRLEANLEFWLTDHGYPATTSATGTATEAVTRQSATLAYGLRVHANDAGHFQPYGLLAIGLQGNRVEATARGTGTTISEEILTGTGEVGAGLEWRVGHDLYAIDWRHWYGRGSFPTWGARNLDLGGDYIGIALGHRW